MPRITQKGQVTIPRQIRSILRINTGDEIIFEVENEKVLLKKKSASIENIKKYIGFLSHLNDAKSEDIIEELRGEADDFSN